MAHSRYNPFQQRISYDAAWVSRQLGGSGQPNVAGWWRCRCPAHHGDSLDTLALKNVRGGLLVAKCFKGCDPAEIHHEIDRLFQEGRFNLGKLALASSSNTSISGEEQTTWAARIWHSCQPISGSLAERYLYSRGITLSPPPATLRFHPNLPHKPSDQCWPAMIALVQDAAGQPRAVHRTWLASDGSAKAPIEPNKMSLGSVSGAAVRLGDAIDAVVISEGIETGLAVTVLLAGQPTWAALSTSGMKTVQLPPSIRSITIAADNDAPGIEAAQTLCSRLEAEGRSVTMTRPNREGADFNDVLVEAVR